MTLVFRYDNAPYHPSIPNFPHHKHIAAETTVVASNAPTFADVLREIEALVV